MFTLEVYGIDEQPAFAKMAESLDWKGDQPTNLGVLLTKDRLPQDIGCLVLTQSPNMARTGVDEPLRLVSAIHISDTKPAKEGRLHVAKSQADAEAYGGYNPQNPHVAKGLGDLGGNVPEALARHYAKTIHAGLWEVPLDGGVDDVFVGPGSNWPISLAGRLLTHAEILWRANKADSKAQELARERGQPVAPHPGTDGVVAEWASLYDGRPFGLFPLSPVIRLHQLWHHTPQPKGIIPVHTFVNGQARVPLEDLVQIGECELPIPA